MHLLVAEDDQRLARLLQRGLTAEGHVVEAVNDGDAAFTMALEGDFDVLILDVMMPGKDGFEVISSLRARHVPTPAQSIAEMTGGTYHRAQDAEQLVGVFRNLPKEVVLQKQHIEVGFGFTAAGAVLALIATGLALAWNRYT